MSRKQGPREVGMRPAAIAASRRQLDTCIGMIAAEAAA